MANSISNPTDQEWDVIQVHVHVKADGPVLLARLLYVCICKEFDSGVSDALYSARVDDKKFYIVKNRTMTILY